MQQLLKLVIEQLRGAWRFRWLWLGLTCAAAVAGWLYVFSMPDEYTVEARVHIDTESAIGRLLSGMASTPNAARQAAILIKTVKSSPNLMEIARNTGLALEVTNSKEEQALLEQLYDKIEVSGNRSTDLYSISYTGTDPKRAHAVVQQVIRIMTRMIAESGGNAAGDATTFIQGEVNTFEAQLDQAHRSLLAFKKDHPDLVVSDEGYPSRLGQLTSELARLESEITIARNRRQALAVASVATTVPPEQTVQVQSLDARINELENGIAALMTHFTPNHPDVVSAEDRLARMKQQRAEMITKLRLNPQLRRLPGGGGVNSLALAEISIRINSLQTQSTQVRAEIDELRANATQISADQATLERLQREYRVAKEQHQNILGRLYAARLSSDVQSSTNPLEFHVIDPPVVPAEPSGPRRLMLITMVMAASLLAGGAFAFFMGQIRPIFLTRLALAEYTQLPVIGSISLAATLMQKARRRTASIVFLGCVAALLLGYLGVLSFAMINADMVSNPFS